ncbi:DUF4166 domain-containing protein [Ahrensia sp. R2A130]|uniref:DUF4166 domain-containing protein n=1 Tax=Ahrensia sp. R2A130 TaxID=744979 RepID=UPI0001E0B4CD|nr:DUF4166 domain-containing protein [Ahrensia sp. R2A130]EFL88711.1 conserved hypothetical protein [Ahrensia sp. R2A130]
MKPAARIHPDAAPHHIARNDNSLIDLRFRALLAKDEWDALPTGTRRRFAKRVSDGRAVVYVGRLTKMHLSRAGRWLAHGLRIIGAPLPINEDVNVPSVVAVTEDVANGGQVWTRVYANNKRFPQVIHSAKRFSGPTGLEEYVGCGVAMALNVRVENAVLLFESAGYYLRFGKRRLRLPRFLMPGDLRVSHRDLCDTDEGRFEFGLKLHHPWLGTLLEQVGVFEEQKEPVHG